MLADFFQYGPIPPNALTGTYDIKLVILSYLVATFASYIALDITGRLRDTGNTPFSKLMWLCGGSVAMGAGIWSMHFIGMLAFSIPNMPMNYDPLLTAISMLVAILASGFALFLLQVQVIRVTRLAIGGIILGLAIASMHYTGMEAMKQGMDIHYVPSLFLLSIAIAIVASEAALWLALKSNQVVAKLRVKLKTISAFIMGAAIVGMHYTGMAAAVFTHNPMGMMHDTPTIDPSILAISIAGVTFIILGIAFFVSTYKEALNQQLLLTAKQAGMAEVAASVLHNVGNVLNSIGVSAALLQEKIGQSKIDGINELAVLLNENRDNLSNFFSNDPRAKEIPVFLNTLSSYWKDEKSMMTSEIDVLIKNIEHVKTIIAMQQELSKVQAPEQFNSIQDLIEEALLITGLNEANKNLHIEKKYASLNHVLVDKIKLLQILVNLLRNAKDALIASDNTNKYISIQIGIHDNNHFFVTIHDNGVGILPENKTKIFGYGFTTKQNGHGFGLHSSAIAANEMGGSLNAESNGRDKGATFTLILPYKLSKNAVPTSLSDKEMA